MNDFDFIHDDGISGNDPCGENKETDGEHTALVHVISLLKALVGILDIISDHLGKYG